MTSEAPLDLIRSHCEELTAKYTGLMFDISAGEYVVKGFLRFSASAKEVGIPEVFQGDYQIAISIPRDYPKSYPCVREVGGKIDTGFHINPDGTLCLGAPIAIRKTFDKNPTLIGFVESCLIPFLYSYEYKLKYGKLPFGELSHGDLGIVEHYRSSFNVADDYALLGLLKILADESYRGHLECPCGSKQRLRNCHGEQLLDLKPHQSQNAFLMDYVTVMGTVLKNGTPIPRAVLSKVVAKNVDLSRLEKNGAII